MNPLQQLIKTILDLFGLTVYEDGSAKYLGCIFGEWGCYD
jgi:hypothetical protein